MDKNPEIFRSGIYQIRCLVNGKMYIGSAKNFHERWVRHKERLRKGLNHSPYLQNSWNKYGEDQFAFEIIEFVDNLNDLIPVEQQYLDVFTPHNSDIGYNVSPSANSSLGIKRSPETLVRMAAAASRHRHTEESKRKMSIASTGRRWTEETKQRMSEIQKGRPCPPERRARISATLTGRKPSPETRAKLSVARMGNKNSLGRVQPPEIREKIAEASRQMWAKPGFVERRRATIATKKKIKFAHGDHIGGKIAERSLGLEIMVA